MVIYKTPNRELKYVIGRYANRSETFGDSHHIVFASERYCREKEPDKTWFSRRVHIEELSFYQTIAKL